MNDFRVGLFVIVSAVVIGMGWAWALDGLRPDEPRISVTLRVPSADGLWEGSAVRLAGVDVGAISEIEVEGSEAILTLHIRDVWQIPSDSVASIRSSGLLGDRYVSLELGHAEGRLADGGRLALAEVPGDIDAVVRQSERIADDVAAVTAVVRRIAENEGNTEAIEGILRHLDALTRELAATATANRDEVDRIASSLARLTEAMEDFTQDLDRDVGNELATLQAATEKLDATLANLESITGKVDRGEGTLGALVHERDLADNLNETVEEAGDLVRSFSGLKAEVYYLGRVYGGSQPADPAFFYGNPLAPNLDGGFGLGGSNTLGLELRPQEDFGWIVEVNDTPNGAITNEEHVFPEAGTGYTEWIRRDDYRFTFLMTKRWADVAFRLGVLESGGGVGVSGYLLRDRLRLSADVFDFAFGAYPAFDALGLPNLRVAARAEPIRHVWFEAGAEQVLLGARYGYGTGFVGIGFHFADDDVKWLLNAVPIGL